MSGGRIFSLRMRSKTPQGRAHGRGACQTDSSETNLYNMGRCTYFCSGLSHTQPILSIIEFTSSSDVVNDMVDGISSSFQRCLYINRAALTLESRRRALFKTSLVVSSRQLLQFYNHSFECDRWYIDYALNPPIGDRHISRYIYFLLETVVGYMMCLVLNVE